MNAHFLESDDRLVGINSLSIVPLGGYWAITSYQEGTCERVFVQKGFLILLA